VYSVKTNKHIQHFSPSDSHTFLVLFSYQISWQYADGNPPTGASNAGGVGKNRHSQPICGFIACCERSDHQVLYTQLRRKLVTLIAGNKAVTRICFGGGCHVELERRRREDRGAEGVGSGEGYPPSPENFCIFYFKMVSFCACLIQHKLTL